MQRINWQRNMWWRIYLECECECDKSCNVGEYLDYANCKCRKRLTNYVKINSANPLYLIIDKTDGYFKEKNGNKYLVLHSADKNKEVLIKYTKLQDGIKNSVEKVNNKLSENGQDFMNIKLNSDDNLSLNKTQKLHNKTLIIRSVFEKDGKYYPQVFLNECLYEF